MTNRAGKTKKARQIPALFYYTFQYVRLEERSRRHHIRWSGFFSPFPVPFVRQPPKWPADESHPDAARGSAWMGSSKATTASPAVSPLRWPCILPGSAAPARGWSDPSPRTSRVSRLETPACSRDQKRTTAGSSEESVIARLDLLDDLLGIFQQADEVRLVVVGLGHLLGGILQAHHPGPFGRDKGARAGEHLAVQVVGSGCRCRRVSSRCCFWSLPTGT